MSSKAKKGKAAKEGPRVKSPGPSRPAGKAPIALVTGRHGTGVVTRDGRGFSIGELEGAGIPSRLASRWGVRFDIRRRSVIPGNVDALRNWGSHATAGSTAEGRAKRLEEEVEKAGRKIKEGAVKAEREVRKEAREVEKEAAKAEEEVKEGAVKAEKAVKRKVSKAKSKPKSKSET